MNLLHKSILILITSSIFLFLIFATFITNSISRFENPFYENTKQWLYQIVENNDSYTLSNRIKSNSWAVYMNKINTSDKVFFSYWEVKTNKSNNNIEINITPGVYYFQLKEINTKYTILWEWFQIINEWPWDIIVNNINPRKIFVFSIDTISELKLKHIKTNEEITSIYLYPHEYLIFNNIKSIFVKNSDLLKIDQTFILWYFDDKIENSERFIKLITNRSDKWIDFINTTLAFLKKDIEQKETYINEYINSSFWVLPWEKIINKYFDIFINPNKKSIYYKNLILREIHDLLKSDNINLKLINDINKNYISLNKIDQEWGKQIYDFIVFNYTNIINTDSSINSKVNFSKLINKINNKTSSYLTSLIYLQKVFYNFNSKDFYKNINEFTKKYFEELNISINWEEKNKWSINEIKDIDYLLYFLENIMITSNSTSTNTLWDIVSIFDNYVNISNYFYSYSSDEIKRVWLFTYSKILNKFIKLIDTNYFIIDKDTNLLRIKEWVNINKKDILLLEKNINTIFIFFNNNKIVLNTKRSNKDRFLESKLYPDLEKKYKEYFYALKDYDEYLAIYDTSKKELLNTNSINEKENKILLSIDSAKEYLLQFNWVKINNATINIMDYAYCLDPIKENENIIVETPYCYKIDNIIIDRQNVSLILYPFEQNKISNIIIDWKIKTWSYKLDIIKTELDEKLKTIKLNKEPYMFENYLVNTFWRKLVWTNNSNNSNNNENIKIKQEDPVIRIFKRNKLLWESWDFANIYWSINIIYDNLNVEKKWESYSIYIDSASFSVKESKDKWFQWLFSSEYDFSNKHSFINPELLLLDKKSGEPLLFWNKIIINWEYKVNNISEWIKNVLSNYEKIKYVVYQIVQSLNNQKIEINYNKNTNEYNIKTNYNWKEFIVTIVNSNITRIYYNWNSILDNKINYLSINNILNKITN